MGYTFKSGSRIKKKEFVRKSGPEADVLIKLRSFLDATEPRLVYLLITLWKNEGRAITYKELREAVLAGYISEEYLEQWRQDYSKFVVDHLKPEWDKAIETATEDLSRRFPDWRFNPMADGIRQWTEQRSADFVTSVTENQMMAIRALVQKAAVLNELNVDQLARAIRPTVGLYYGQAIANFNYHKKLLENGVKEKRALDLSIRYADRQKRYRAMMIARQELAMAYNTGADQAVRQAQAAGYLGEMVKVFCCADDERVCSVCGALEGAIVGMNEEFKVKNKGNYKFTNLYPPVHIQCRCSVLYEEISPPAY